jgi:hypothetical protein
MLKRNLSAEKERRKFGAKTNFNIFQLLSKISGFFAKKNVISYWEYNMSGASKIKLPEKVNKEKISMNAESSTFRCICIKDLVGIHCRTRRMPSLQCTQCSDPRPICHHPNRFLHKLGHFHPAKT